MIFLLFVLMSICYIIIDTCSRISSLLCENDVDDIDRLLESDVFRDASDLHLMIENKRVNDNEMTSDYNKVKFK